MLNIELPYDPAVTFLGIYPVEIRTFVHTVTYTQMFIPPLLIIAKKVEPTKNVINWCAWINKM